MNDNDTKIAVLSEKMEGLREQQKAHATETNTKLDNINHTITTLNNWLQQNSTIPPKVDELWNHHQKQKGFFHASKLFSGALGGALVWAIDYVSKMTDKVPH